MSWEYPRSQAHEARSWQPVSVNVGEADLAPGVPGIDQDESFYRRKQDA